MSSSVKAVTPWSEDKMERRGVAKFLTRYLDSNSNINVLTVNAPWGAGKTFFIENWYAELLHERAAVYFNAWQHDYAGDAFVALTAAINDALLSFIPLGVAEEALGDFRKKATSVILAATPALAKGVLKKFTGVDVAAVSESIDADALADAAEKALDEILQSNQKTMRIVEDFKKRFSELAIEASLHKAVESNVEAKPLYIFIDELDRCRPTFSIELLERVKHFFDVKGCKFVIACDLEQLQHSISAVYGGGFDGAKYLKRFFDAEYSLDYVSIEGWIKAQVFDATQYADIPVLASAVSNSSYFPGRRTPVSPSANAVLSGGLGLDKYQIILLAVAQTFKLKLRELEKSITHVRAICSAMESFDFDFFWATYLVILRDEAPRLYRKVLEGNDEAAWDEIMSLYPAKTLYCGVANESVHSIAKIYFSCFHGGKGEVHKMLNRDDDSGTLKSYALWQFANQKYDAMSRYPYYVDLAHNIE
ncbi:KAP family P-loop NTPase fold protein [Ectopseudomonas khazarica]|uniref:KAP family P-loop NTPase fold protein n=1 Tax=Ectopseudomonas khazarica TaxID=2502979 RepID=UPI003B939097